MPLAPALKIALAYLHIDWFWIRGCNADDETEEYRNLATGDEMRPDPKNPFHIVAAITIAVLILYYITSPYQNCMRAGGYNARGCVSNTSW